MNINIHIANILNYEFAEPAYLWALCILPLLALWKYISLRKPSSIALSTVGKHQKLSSGFYLAHWALFSCTLLGLAALICAMARPQDPEKQKELKESFVEGIDIMIAMDISGSMNAEDLKDRDAGIRNRLEASIYAAKSFIDSRKNDNIGLVVYGGEAFMMSPLSTDHNNLKQKMDELTTDIVVPKTAIGDGLNLAAASIYQSKAESKIIILLTDGVNNAGEKDPLEAAENAKAYGIKVYTIGLGTNGEAEIPVNYGGIEIKQRFPVEIDEETLEGIAKATDGQYYRAQTGKELVEIYDVIDQLETSAQRSLSVNIEAPEEFRSFAIPGLILLFVSLIVQNLFFRQIT